MLTVVIDARFEDIDSHARYLLKKIAVDDNMPRVAAATRALIPGYCYYCDDPWWGPMQGICICTKCKKEHEEKKVGF